MHIYLGNVLHGLADQCTISACASAIQYINKVHTVHMKLPRVCAKYRIYLHNEPTPSTGRWNLTFFPHNQRTTIIRKREPLEYSSWKNATAGAHI